MDVNIRRLRLKIEDDAQEPRYIATVWGTGLLREHGLSRQKRFEAERK